MDKPFTVQNSINQTDSDREEDCVTLKSSEPSEESLQFILNYSKALTSSKTRSLGEVFTLLN